MTFARSTLLRRWYFAMLAILLGALLVLRVTALESPAGALLQSLSAICDNLMAASITAIIVGVAYAYFFPADEHSRHEVVRAADIAQVIADECRHAREWSVRSRGGNYITTVTLTSLIESALTTGRAVRVRIQCIDPEDDALLAAYARSMSDIKARVGAWTPMRARREVYASVLRAAVKCAEAPRVEVQFGFSNSLWVMSLDLTDHSALVTCQNKGEDALLFRSDSQFYQSYCDDFDASWHRCRKVSIDASVQLPKNASGLKGEHIVSINSLFENVGLVKQSDETVREIVRAVGRDHDYV